MTRRERTPAACPHNGRHRHGTPAAYTADRCGCGPCRNAYRHATGLRELDRARGVPAFVPAAPARAHITYLRSRGMGERTIAQHAGVSVAVINGLAFGRGGVARARIRPDIEAAILGTRPALALDACCDPTGTRRRLQALAYNGWPLSELGRRLGYTGRSAQVRPGQWMAFGVRRRTADRVAALYDRLWDSPPPRATPYQRAAATAVRNRARARGWAPPLAWDDDTIDDPATLPQHKARRSL